MKVPTSKALLAAWAVSAVIALALWFAGLTILWALLAGINVSTLLTYGYDKARARAGGWRVPEAALHILAASGGTPGALAGQLIFRHKTRARRFRLVFFAITAAQIVALAAVARLCGIV